MPTDYIKKLSKAGKGSVPALEAKWERAKAQAKKAGQSNNFAYVTSIFKTMIGASAVTRLQATSFDSDYGEALFKEMTKDLDVDDDANETLKGAPTREDNDK